MHFRKFVLFSLGGLLVLSLGRRETSCMLFNLRYPESFFRILEWRWLCYLNYEAERDR